MAANLALVTEVAPATPPAPTTEIDRAFADRGARSGILPLPRTLLRQLIVGWTRLHGVISLDLDGHFGDHLPAADLVYEAEVDDLVRWLDETIEELRLGDH